MQLVPVQIVGTDIFVHCASEVFSQASAPNRKAVLAVVSVGDSPGYNSFLYAFVTTDSGQTWSAIKAVDLFCITPNDWNGTGGNLGTGPHDTIGGLPTGSNENNLNNGTPSFPPPNGYNLMANALQTDNFAAREGNSDDVFCICLPSNRVPHYGEQSPPPNPPNPGISSFPISVPDYISQQVLYTGSLHLFRFNLATFAFTDRGQCGVMLVDPIYGQYDHSFYSGVGVASFVRIAGISGGRGISFGGTSGYSADCALISAVLVPNGAAYPFSAQVMNFDAIGTTHYWDWVLDPDSALLGGSYQNGLTTGPAIGVDPVSGDILTGGLQYPDPYFGFGERFRTVRWTAGGTSPIPASYDVASSGGTPSVFDSIPYEPLASGSFVTISLFKPSTMELGQVSWSSAQPGDASGGIATNPVLGINPIWREIYVKSRSDLPPDKTGYRLYNQGLSLDTAIGLPDLYYQNILANPSASPIGTAPLYASNLGPTDTWVDIVSLRQLPARVSLDTVSRYKLYYWAPPSPGGFVPRYIRPVVIPG